MGRNALGSGPVGPQGPRLVKSSHAAFIHFHQQLNPVFLPGAAGRGQQLGLGPRTLCLACPARDANQLLVGADGSKVLRGARYGVPPAPKVGKHFTLNFGLCARGAKHPAACAQSDLEQSTGDCTCTSDPQGYSNTRGVSIVRRL